MVDIYIQMYCYEINILYLTSFSVSFSISEVKAVMPSDNGRTDLRRDIVVHSNSFGV